MACAEALRGPFCDLCGVIPEKERPASDSKPSGLGSAAFWIAALVVLFIGAAGAGAFFMSGSDESADDVPALAALDDQADLSLIFGDGWANETWHLYVMGNVEHLNIPVDEFLGNFGIERRNLRYKKFLDDEDGQLAGMLFSSRRSVIDYSNSAGFYAATSKRKYGFDRLRKGVVIYELETQTDRGSNSIPDPMLRRKGELVRLVEMKKGVFTILWPPEEEREVLMEEVFE